MTRDANAAAARKLEHAIQKAVDTYYARVAKLPERVTVSTVLRVCKEFAEEAEERWQRLPLHPADLLNPAYDEDADEDEDEDEYEECDE